MKKYKIEISVIGTTENLNELVADLMDQFYQRAYITDASGPYTNSAGEMYVTKEARTARQIAKEQAYIEKPSCCPHCESDNIESGSLDADGNVATATVSCLDCGKTWSDVYRLVDVEL